LSQPASDPQLLQVFAELVAQRFGWSFEAGNLQRLEEVLARRCRVLRQHPREYLRALAQEPGQEREALIQELTVGETYFFRHREQMDAFVQVALPERNTIRGARPLRLLSAGCSSGEEPFSLAILAREAGVAPQELQVVAADINPGALAKAARGRYTRWALRETPPDIRSRWFRQQGKELVLDRSLRESVTFREANLAAPSSLPWPAGFFDVVFCRNFLMYLTMEQARRVVARLTFSLAPDGYLFLGHAETLRGLSDEFDLVSTHDCFYYRRLCGVPARAVRTEELPTSLAQDWMELIQGASERIRLMSRESAEDPLHSPISAPMDLPQVRELAERERYEQALQAFQQLPLSACESGDGLQLHALLLLHLGDLAGTETVCLRWLEREPMAPGAHYLLALCREGEGDLDGAAREHRAAVRLDPGFPMPHLRLGLLSRRAHDLPGARRELEKALLLLQSEPWRRLRLYAGGFGREALVTLCRSELGACRGRR
jgi:chemotaxis protein methyltransferase CheR